jgi:hypothetical protein
MGGYRKHVIAEHLECIHEQIKQTPHLTLNGMKGLHAGRRVIDAHQAVWWFIRDEGLRLKIHCSLLNRLAYGSSRLIALILIQQNRPSERSNTGCDPSRNETSKILGVRSRISTEHFRQKNAQDTSEMLDMFL